MVKNEQTDTIEKEKKLIGISENKESAPKEEKKVVRNLENKGNQSEEISKTKEQEKTAKKEKEKPKKTEAVINAYNIPVSTKYSIAICKFIKNKKISDAIVNLGQVIKLKKAVPMKGEIPHRKGKRMMSGRFPKLASENFIKILKSLSANAVYNNLEEPIIAEAVANMGVRPYGKFGQVRKKRTHIRLIAKSKNKKGN